MSASRHQFTSSNCLVTPHLSFKRVFDDICLNNNDNNNNNNIYKKKFFIYMHHIYTG